MKQCKVWIVSPLAEVGDAGVRFVDDVTAAEIAAREMIGRPKVELVIIEAPTSFGWAYQYHHYDQLGPSLWACWRWVMSFEACEAHLDVADARRVRAQMVGV